MTAIVTGDTNTCAVLTSARVRCWGGTDTGELIGLPVPPGGPPPGGTVGSAYSHRFSSARGTPTGSFSVVAGELPPGLTLSAAGRLDGVPTTAGAFTFTVQIDDGLHETLSSQFTLRIVAELATSAAGWSAASSGGARGDFDGDGHGDLAIGVPGEDIGPAADAGALHVLYGDAAALSATDSQYWTQNSSGMADAVEPGDEFARALAVGDLNGDGFDDLAIGAPGEDSAAGVVHVLYGSSAGLTVTGGQLWSQDSAGVSDSAETGTGSAARSPPGGSAATPARSCWSASRPRISARRWSTPAWSTPCAAPPAA